MKHKFGLNKMEITPMSGGETQKIEGGFFTIVIYGVMLLTASETFACFLTGVGIGAVVAHTQKIHSPIE
jgi:hypothetical protein